MILNNKKNNFMKDKSFYLIAASCIILAILGIYFLRKEEDSPLVKSLVVTKQDIVESSKHKSVTANSSVYYFVVQTEYGYGRVPVTTNTFYTTKVGDQVGLYFNHSEINRYFSKKVECVECFLYKKIGFTLIGICLLVLMITLAAALSE